MIYLEGLPQLIQTGAFQPCRQISPARSPLRLDGRQPWRQARLTASSRSCRSMRLEIFILSMFPWPHLQHCTR